MADINTDINEQINRQNLFMNNRDIPSSSYFQMRRLNEQLSDISRSNVSEDKKRATLERVKKNSDYIARKYFMVIRLDLEKRVEEISKRLHSEKFDITEEDKEKLNNLKSNYERFISNLVEKENKLYNLSNLSKDEYEAELGMVDNYLKDKKNLELNSENRQMDFSEIIDLYAPKKSATRRVKESENKKESSLIRFAKWLLSIEDAPKEVQQDAIVTEQKSSIEKIKDDCDILLGRINLELAKEININNTDGNDRKNSFENIKNNIESLVRTINAELQTGGINVASNQINTSLTPGAVNSLNDRINARTNIEERYAGCLESFERNMPEKYLPDEMAKKIKSMAKLDRKIEVVEKFESFKQPYNEKFKEAKDLNPNLRSDRDKLVKISDELKLKNDNDLLNAKISKSFYDFIEGMDNKNIVTDPDETFVISDNPFNITFDNIYNINNINTDKQKTEVKCMDGVKKMFGLKSKN